MTDYEKTEIENTYLGQVEIYAVIAQKMLRDTMKI